MIQNDNSTSKTVGLFDGRTVKEIFWCVSVVTVVEFQEELVNFKISFFIPISILKRMFKVLEEFLSKTHQNLGKFLLNSLSFFRMIEIVNIF